MARRGDAMLALMERHQMTTAVKWSHWCVTYLGLSPETTHAVWSAFQSSQHPSVRGFVFAWRQMSTQPHRRDEIMRFIDHTMTPRHLCEWLEHLVEEWDLDRATASAVEEQVLFSTLPTGRWREDAV